MFELKTNCVELLVDDQKFRLPHPSEGSDTIQRMFELKLDEDELVAGFGPMHKQDDAHQEANP